MPSRKACGLIRTEEFTLESDTVQKVAQLSNCFGNYDHFFSANVHLVTGADVLPIRMQMMQQKSRASTRFDATNASSRRRLARRGSLRASEGAKGAHGRPISPPIEVFSVRPAVHQSPKRR
ncbi:hypothetical protein [Comamonas endophytica]|uniref:Uncharacterized protein n=1 Tax=Comamonas endophytica TaxID=2949090 RepID=A0ABY6G9H0_9BURK|nr:hypothetical protein [Acidovorax sp. 5MLIR]UYG51701.1 hypothetical protein M9799_00085 [Acidovorax sp. 5MLIR]